MVRIVKASGAIKGPFLRSLSGRSTTQVPDSGKDRIQCEVERLEQINRALRAKNRESNKAAETAATRIAKLENELAQRKAYVADQLAQVQGISTQQGSQTALQFYKLKMERMLSAARDELSELYKLEEKGFDSYAQKVVGSIEDSQSALMAAHTYGLWWFQSLPFSTEKKIILACLLSREVSKFNSSYVNGLWTNITNRTVESLRSIRYRCPE